MRSVFLVFIGSGLGGALRHLVGLASLRLLGPGFPWGTLTINVLGSTLMGAVAGLFAARSWGHPEWRLFLATGVLGGFTTWSTFSLDVVTLWERGRPAAALGYVAASLILSFAFMAAALLIARR
ncbi:MULTISPECIES: fluoride efflux transporter CrcB [Sphingomonadales]|uniref:Fluoride-specific ion channel FluC n=2 Tax=Edaphosphingomonas TaxID=3423724 RepID=A0A2T4HYE9_9SPHN|nr:MULTISPECIES: fluoride efflux transporter CrcB [Sphingomonas]AGH51031.1 camphor resistance protein CrcB [Sphingomonas sp. MM-1]MDX3885227.1 fluoride efflux transporter CrcB [Sphingomonas sp.]OHT19585.1 putative fluoride ion transporter CrcB [Sphingomonas haloaromaticamans]PTD21116.1 fluoride efflux transporter CrcB [Sphingomonas fennica]